MLFNRGEKLLVPEVVPFRMTHNMIDAMGVLGVEGTFRKSCEIILRVLQKEKNTLLAYLRPIIYDVTSKHVNEKGEGIEKEAVTSYKNVQSRLNGIATKYQSNSGIPLSVEGHVNFIIKEATSESNLAGMFRGWMPWM
jgi:serine/threonine-protein kinase ATR